MKVLIKLAELQLAELELAELELIETEVYLEILRTVFFLEAHIQKMNQKVNPSLSVLNSW